MSTYPFLLLNHVLCLDFNRHLVKRNAAENQIAQYPNASSLMDCSSNNRTDEMSSHFISDFNVNNNASVNRTSQLYETSSGMPILTAQNTQYNPMDTIPPTDAIGPIHFNKHQKRIPTERSP
ncbi:hypothetical protein CEXT_798421 [Caerostris extrusa]|uniref:Uncharacterized protein n=1 Tax=Caerostris extrusa TaxID=172846 RepID=A0AAV4WU39_CAEEX|nr:hypothetical protein CEXT_798421 [Caerostris extrusa]